MCKLRRCNKIFLMNRNVFSKDFLYLYIVCDLIFKSLVEENLFFKNKRNMYCNFFYYEELFIRLFCG